MALTQKEVARNYLLDFFHLDETAYPLRIARYPDTQLKKSEQVKTRICYSAMCSIISGVTFSVATHGGSAVVCVWAARRWHVAARKLKHIKAELTNRNIALRPFLHRDWIIPASIALVAVSIGLGVELGISAIVPVGHAGDKGLITLQGTGHTPSLQHAVEHGTNHTVIDSNTTAHNVMPMQNVLGPPGGQTVSQDWAAGFRDQLHSLFGSSHHAIAGTTADGTYDSAVAWVTGAHSAELMEKQMMVLLGQQTVSMLCERLDTESLIPKHLHRSLCLRVPWTTDTFCSICNEPIQSGKFTHCCKCEIDDEELNLCRNCDAKLPQTHNESHSLMRTQVALPGQFYLPEAAVKMISTIAGPKLLACNSCGNKVTRRWHYDCWKCRENGKHWTQCLACYRSGRTCPGADNHTFYAFQRAIYAHYSEDSPYRKKREVGSGQASCSLCQTLVTKGAYYHCTKCDKGTFDICALCFAQDEHCKDNSHVLKKYYAFKYQRYADVATREWWRCSNIQCQFWTQDYDFFFSCREENCTDSGAYKICPGCYFLDHLCPNKEHDMFKCVWK